jgi:hypothetical protein
VVDPKILKYHNIAEELDAYVMDAEEQGLDESLVQALRAAASAARNAKEALMKQKEKD